MQRYRRMARLQTNEMKATPAILRAGKLRLQLSFDWLASAPFRAKRPNFSNRVAGQLCTRGSVAAQHVPNKLIPLATYHLMHAYVCHTIDFMID